jgi:hypothetical protein
MRLTRLDECGAIVEGLTSTLVTDAFVQVTDTPVYQDPEDIQQTNANGDLCVDDQSDPALRWLDLNLQFCRVDPDAINIVTGDPLVVDDAVAPNTVGYRLDALLTGTANFALEIWAGVPGQACTAGGFPVYGYFLYPWVKQARWDESVPAANAAHTFAFTARTQAGSAWGVGPYDIRRDAAIPATLEPLLTPIGANQHKHFEFSSAPLPTAACGAVELAIP